MMTKDEALAMDLALEALEGLKSIPGGRHELHELNAIHRKHDRAITAIKQARSAPVQEPKETDFSRALRLYAEAGSRLSPAQPAPVQEPVAWMHEWDDGERVPMLRKRDVDSSDIDSPKSVRPLVFGDTTPPAQPAPVQEPDHGNELTIAYMSGLHDGKKKRQWVGLTDEERDEICLGDESIARSIEAKLRDKNGGNHES
jgi:hypothetical protein